MNFYEVLKKRRMRRHFIDTEIPDEVTQRIIWSISRAPSAGHTQGNRILVLKSRQSREDFWRCCQTANWPPRQEPSLRFASLLIVILENETAYRERYQLQDKGDVLRRNDGQFVAPYWTIDASFMAMIGQLCAIEEGLDYLFFGLHQGIDELFEAFTIPRQLKVTGVLAIGRSQNVNSGSALLREKVAVEEIIIGGRIH